MGANPFINSWLDVYIIYFSCFQVSFSEVLISGKAYSFLQVGLEVRYGVILYSIVPSMLLIKLHNLGKTLDCVEVFSSRFTVPNPVCQA